MTSRSLPQTLAVALLTALSSACGGTYEPRLFSVTHGNGRYVSVGEGGVVVSSTDLKRWTAAESGSSSHLTDVHFANGRFVAVGASGAVLVSEDGLSWTSATTGTARDLNAVTHYAASSLWISVGAEGEVSTSPDGLVWTVRHTGSAWLAEVAVSAIEILAVEAGSEGELSSVDGIVWTRTAQPLGGRCGVAFGNDAWVSADFEGTTHRRPSQASPAFWQTSASGMWTAGSGCDMAAGDGFFAAAAPAEGDLLTSPDGITWTKQFKSKNALRGLVVVGTEVVTVGSFGEVAHATCPLGVCGTFSEQQISVPGEDPTPEAPPGGRRCSITFSQCCSNQASLCGVSPATCDDCPTDTRKGIICAAGSPCNTSGGISAGSRICHCS